VRCKDLTEGDLVDTEPNPRERLKGLVYVWRTQVSKVLSEALDAATEAQQAREVQSATPFMRSSRSLHII
jgi:hypothetical protein